MTATSSDTSKSPHQPKNVLKSGWWSLRNLLLLLLVGVGLLTTLFLLNQRVRVRPKAAGNQAHFYFQPPTETLSTNQTKTVVLWADVGTFAPLPDGNPNGVGFARVEFDFDKAALQLASEIAVSTNNPLQTVNVKTSKTSANSTGHVVLALGLPAVTPPDPLIPATGAFPFAELTFTTTSTANSTTNVTVSGTGNQVIDLSLQELGVVKDPEVITLNPTGATATPTPPGATATPTHAPAATATPTRVPTITPTVGPSVTPNPTKANFRVRLQLQQRTDNSSIVHVIGHDSAGAVIADYSNVSINSAGVSDAMSLSTDGPVTGAVFWVEEGSHLSKVKSGVDLAVGAVGDVDFGVLLAGDLVRDGNSSNVIDIYDYTQIVHDFESTQQGIAADLDADGDVDIYDYVLLVANFDQHGQAFQ